MTSPRSFSPAALVLLLAAPLAAQDTTSAPAPAATPFRDGQWAVQFAAGTSFASLGFLKFTSERGAWSFDVRANLTRLDSDDTTASFFSSFEEAVLRVGRRSYTARARDIVSFFGGGVSAFYDHSTFTTPLGDQKLDRGGVGIYAELGASWLITRSLGLGATVDAGVGYEQTKITGQEKISGFGVSVGQIAIVGTLYF